MKILDFSYARPDPNYIKSQGFEGVMRYLSFTPGKNLSIAERDAYWNAGLWVGLIWETTANRALAGYSAGIADATEAKKQADALGFHGAIYFAVDFDATEAQQEAINNYAKGAATVLGDRVGLYGGYYVIKRAFDAQVIKWGWQTYAWSGGHRDSRAQIYQYSNGQWNDTVDFNDAQANFGGQLGGNTMAYKTFATERELFDLEYGDIVITFKTAWPSQADRDWAWNRHVQTGAQVYTIVQEQYHDELFGNLEAAIANLETAKATIADLTTKSEEAATANKDLQTQIDELKAQLAQNNANVDTRNGWQLIADGIKKLFRLEVI